jgi:predicted flap endonuclease-1-like 5' DNA nuclease
MQRERIMPDSITTYWPWLLALVILGGLVAAWWLSPARRHRNATEEARRTAEANAAQAVRRFAETKTVEDARRATEAKATEDARRLADAGAAERPAAPHAPAQTPAAPPGQQPAGLAAPLDGKPEGLDDSSHPRRDPILAIALDESAPAAAPAVETEPRYPGRRPDGFATPPDGQADDLKRIKGIGPRNEERLHALGIWRYSQIAAWTPDNVRWVGACLAFPGRIDREHWIDQAKALAQRTE